MKLSNHQIPRRLKQLLLSTIVLAAGVCPLWSAVQAAPAKSAKGKKPVAEAAADGMAPAAAPAASAEDLRLPDDPPDAKLTIVDDFTVDQPVTPKLIAALTAKPPAGARRKKVAPSNGAIDPVMDLPMAK